MKSTGFVILAIGALVYVAYLVSTTSTSLAPTRTGAENSVAPPTKAAEGAEAIETERQSIAAQSGNAAPSSFGDLGETTVLASFYANGWPLSEKPVRLRIESRQSRGGYDAITELDGAVKWRVRSTGREAFLVVSVADTGEYCGSSSRRSNIEGTIDIGRVDVTKLQSWVLRIKDEEGGLVGGARVVFSHGTGSREIVSNEFGEVNLWCESNKCIDYVTVYKSGFYAKHVENINPWIGKETSLVLRRGPHIYGYALLEGKKVTKGRVSLSIPGSLSTIFQEMGLSSNGAYRFESVPDAPKLDLVFFVPNGGQGAKRLDMRKVRPDGGVRCDVEIGSGHSVSGRVIDTTGEPVAGVLVTLSRALGDACKRTDANGKYVFDRVHAFGDRILLAFHKDGFCQRRIWIGGDSDSCSPSMFKEVLVSGKVVTDKSEAVSGAVLRAVYDGNEKGVKTITDDQGRYTVSTCAVRAGALEITWKGVVVCKIGLEEVKPLTVIPAKRRPQNR